MSACGAEHADQWGTVACTKRKNHGGDHWALDADTSFVWTDEIDELRDIREGKR